MTVKAAKADKAKPFTQGTPADENTLHQVLIFFGAMFIVGFMSFLVCSMTAFDSAFLRVGINLVIEALILIIFFNRGATSGTDAVARGEILFQHEHKGIKVTENEKRIPYHPVKGFLIGLLGASLFLILAIILALTSKKQMTGAGTLPSWMDAYMRRSEISDALSGYLQSDPLRFTDIIRTVIRILIMPFVSMAGAENRNMLLMIDRISPLLVLLPAVSYGIGYMQGPAQRKKIHTEIAANAKKRKIREKRERRAKNAAPKGPEQLN